MNLFHVRSCACSPGQVFTAAGTQPTATKGELIDVAWNAPQTAIVHWQQWCERAGNLHWLTDFTTRHYEDEHYALQAALGGQGYILASDVLAQDSVRRGHLQTYRPDIVLEGADYVARCRPGQERTPAIKHMLDWIAAEVIQ